MWFCTKRALRDLSAAVGSGQTWASSMEYTAANMFSRVEQFSSSAELNNSAEFSTAPKYFAAIMQL